MSKQTISESEVYEREDGDWCECVYCGETSRLLYDYEEEEEEPQSSVEKSVILLYLLLVIVFSVGLFLPLGIVAGFEILELLK